MTVTLAFVERTWRMTVEHSFRITGRGVVVFGSFEGVVHQGDPAVVRVGDMVQRIDHIHFDIPRATYADGRPVVKIGILFGKTVDPPPVGTIVEFGG
jgi:translation elongation factor EF-Tu-like GTPase